MSIENKVVIITGAASGIGKGIAIKFATLKAKLSLVDKTGDALEETVKICDKFGAKTLKVIADLTKDEDIRRIVKETVTKFDKIDVLINCAGILGGGDINQKNLMEEFDTVMAVNLRAVIYLTHLATPYLVKTKGAIINIASVASIGVCPRHISYCSTKAGLDHLSRCLALDLAPTGVRVNSILPGPVKTKLLENNLGRNADDIFDGFEKRQPTGRNVEIEEVAKLALFLADDEIKSLTGASIVLDGAWSLQGMGHVDVPWNQE